MSITNNDGGPSRLEPPSQGLSEVTFAEFATPLTSYQPEIGRSDSAVWLSEVANGRMQRYEPQIAVTHSESSLTANPSSPRTANHWWRRHAPPRMHKQLEGARAWLERRISIRQQRLSSCRGGMVEPKPTAMLYSFASADCIYYGGVDTATHYEQDPFHRYDVSVESAEVIAVLQDIEAFSGFTQINVKDHSDIVTNEGPLSATVTFLHHSDHTCRMIIENVRDASSRQVEITDGSQIRLGQIAVAGLEEADKTGAAFNQVAPLWCVHATPKQASWSGASTDAMGLSTVTVQLEPREPYYHDVKPRRPGLPVLMNGSLMRLVKDEPDVKPVKDEPDVTPIKTEQE